VVLIGSCSDFNDVLIGRYSDFNECFSRAL
jgi:hypothetical protein